MPRHSGEAAAVDKYDSLQDVVTRLGDADGWDLCTRIAALQLLPANAKFRVRLEASMHAAASLPAEGRKFKMSEGRFKSLLSSSELTRNFAWMEDPIENLFCGPVAFFGGEYLVPFDQSPTQSFAFEAFATVLATRPEGVPEHVLQECLGLITAAVVLGDKAIRCAGIPRYTAVESLDLGAPVHPRAERRASLVSACVFSLEELLETCVDRGLPSPVITPLVSTLADADLAVFDSSGGPLYTRPLLRNGESYLVALPAVLCSAACHQVVGLCVAAGCQEALMRAVSDYVWRRVLGSSDNLGLSFGGEIPADGYARTARFEVDTDRTLVVRLAVDPLADHDPEILVGRYESALDEFDALVSTVEECRATGHQIAGLLLIFTTTNGYVVGVADDESTRMCHSMPADVFCTFSALEARRATRLWSYLRDRESLTEYTRILATDERDVLALYRDNGYSFYFSDDARPNMINFTVGSGLAMVHEWATRFDEHVRAVPRMGYGWVTRRWERSSLPVYAPKGLPPGVAVIELPTCDLWVAVNCESLQLAQQLTDTLTYWIARVADDVRSPRAVGGTHTLVLDTSGLESMLESGSLANESATPTTLSKSGATRIVVTDGVPSLFGPADPTGELALVALCLGAIEPNERELYVDYLRHAAARPCRMIQGIDVRQELACDPRGLDAPVFVEQSQVAAILDSAGLELSRRITAKATTADELLNKMVGILYDDLCAALEQFTAPGRATWLAICNEALCAESELSRLSIEGRRGCFGRYGELEDALAGERTERDTASVACRFLIELAACLPSGEREAPTLVEYDELLALSSQVIGFGIESDLLHYELAEFEVSVLPTGRLGRSGHEYQTAVEQYTRAFMESQPDNLADVLRLEMPPRLREAEQAAVQAVMDALPAELGLTIEDIGSALDVLHEIGDRTEPGVVTMLRDEVHALLAVRVGENVANSLLELLVLPSREDFLRPASPHVTPDVYPWRFNRSLSHARRPLVEIPDGRGSLVWGKRQLARSIRLLAQDLESARYKAHSGDMRSAQGRVNDAAGKSFNWRVAVGIRSWFPGSVAVERFEKLGTVRMPGELGDIDVLWALPSQRLLIAVECKHLRPARTPVELASEMDALVVGSDEKPSHIERHSRRVSWLRENSTAVLSALGMDVRRKWRVSGLVVTDVRPMSSFVADVGMPVVALAELAKVSEPELKGLLRRS